MIHVNAISTAELVLGTAQFGLSYGLSKSATPVAADDIADILATAWEGGVRCLDTAAAYGDSERRIGALSRVERPFAIVTKTLPIGRDRIAAEDVAKVCARFAVSQRDLAAPKIDTLLVHNAGDLLADGGQALFDALGELVAQGRVARLGVSVYDPETLDRVLDRFPIGVVQLPLNVFDQRFAANGRLAELAANRIEVHARSVFLQGLLLRAADAVPAHLGHAAPALARFRARAQEAGLTPQAAALSFAANTPGVAKLVVGIDRIDALRANLPAFAAAKRSVLRADDLAVPDPSVVDPRQWKE